MSNPLHKDVAGKWPGQPKSREETMVNLIRRRSFVTGGLASFAFLRHTWAAPPATIADGTTIGRGKMLVVAEDASGRIVALDSSSYLEPHPTGPTDVIVVGSYCGTRILAPIFTRRANAQARALGVFAGQVAYEAAARLTMAPAGKPIPTPLGLEEAPVIVEETPNGRIWATPGSTAIKEKIPHDVFCSGANSSRVFSDGALRMAAKGAIANDAGIAKNDTAVEGVQLLQERGIPAASVGTMSARLGEGLSTWNDGVISVVNQIAARRGVKVGMSAKEAARLMLRSG